MVEAARVAISRRAFVAAAAATPLSWQLQRLGRVGEWLAGAPAVHRGGKEHVVVVGAGAFGGWTALTLLRSGRRVTLIDAWGAGNSRASSGGETRVIRAVYGGSRTYIDMTARALVLWREAERQWQRQVLFRTGALWMCAGDDAYVRTSIEPMRGLGLPVERLSLSEAEQRYPQMSFRDVRTVHLEHDAGFLAARAACELVRETFVREGGSYLQDWVRPGRTSTGRMTGVALSSGGILQAENFVFACGPWMGQVFPDVVGHRIAPTRQEVFYFGPPPADTRFDAGALPVWIHMGTGIVYGLPSHERRGLKVADDSPGERVDPTSLDRTPSVAGLERARAILGERFPSLAGAPLLEARVCQYETSTDGHFLIDRHPGLKNVWLVGGGSGHGFKMGPALGEHVADLVQGRARVNSMFALSRLKPA